MKNLSELNIDIQYLIECVIRSGAKNITIKIKRSTIIFEMKQGKLISHFYKEDSVHQVMLHSYNSYRELQMDFESLGWCLYDLIRPLLSALFWSRKKPFLIDLDPTKTK